MMCIDFDYLQMKPLFEGLISQVILPLNDETMLIHEGDELYVSFNNRPFNEYCLVVTGVSVTSLNKVTVEDINKNGFLYKPAFLEFMQSKWNINVDDSIVKVDFEFLRK